MTQVGRNYMFHNSQAVLALSMEENPTVFQKTLGLNDFYLNGGPDYEFPLGNIQMVGKSQAPMFRGERAGETSTSTAKHMSSTTCTWPTRASSRASAPSTRRSPRWPKRSASGTVCSDAWASARTHRVRR
jgi:hypothetical protein